VRAIAIATLVGCGFRVEAQAPPDDGARDASGGEATTDGMPGDGPVPDTSAPTCVQRWSQGPTILTPSPIGGINTGNSEGDPFVTFDELAIYVASNGDIYRATRASTSAGFGGRTLDTNLSSSTNDSKVSFTADGLTAFIGSERSGGEGATDVWRGTRATTAGSFTFDQMHLAAVNDGMAQWDPHISRDGLRLYLAPIGNGGAQHVAVATRGAPSAAFGTPQTISELQSTVVDNDPTLTADERVIVFASNRDGTRKLWYATRADPTGAFGTPQVVPNVDNGDDGPHLSSDGCRLYFTSQRGGSADIYVAAVN